MTPETLQNQTVQWAPDDMIEVLLPNNDAFLLVMETLKRIGIASRKDKVLYQSCHILHKKGRYFILHFKELFLLDGRNASLTQNDIERRNAIANLLDQWELVKLKHPERAMPCVPVKDLTILSYKEKDQWQLCQKYNIGSKKYTQKN